MGTLCSTDSGSNDTTGKGTNDETNIETIIDPSDMHQPYSGFKEDGDTAFSRGAFLEAAFLYFKHWKIDLGGAQGEQKFFIKALEKAGEDATRLEVFLEEKWAIGLSPPKDGEDSEYGTGFNKYTKWGAAHQAWLNNINTPSTGVAM